MTINKNTELLMLVSNVIVICGLKILNGISMEFMDYLNKDAKKKMDIFCVSGVGLFSMLPVPTCLILNTSFMDSMMI